MGLIIKNYEITTNKINKDISICLLTDLHLGNNTKEQSLIDILENIKIKKPDYICISGDYIDCVNILDNKNIYKQAKEYLRQLAKITKVIYTLGNHDVVEKKNLRERIYGIPEKFIDDIKKINNVIILNNDKYIDKDIEFLGYVTDQKYYGKLSEKQNILIEDYPKKIGIIDNNKFNVLLFHSPINVFKDSTFSLMPELSQIDLILSGHMHNGLVPNWLDKIWKSDRGFISPLKTFFPRYARGIKKKTIKEKDIYLVVSGGVTKVHGLAPLALRFLNYFYTPEVDYIVLKNNSINKKGI